MESVYTYKHTYIHAINSTAPIKPRNYEETHHMSHTFTRYHQRCTYIHTYIHTYTYSTDPASHRKQDLRGPPGIQESHNDGCTACCLWSRSLQFGITWHFKSREHKIQNTKARTTTCKTQKINYDEIVTFEDLHTLNFRLSASLSIHLYTHGYPLSRSIIVQPSQSISRNRIRM